MKLQELYELWSGGVKTMKHPPAGLFASASSAQIVAWLKKEHGDLKGAMSALNFYINRAGKNLSSERKSALETAKRELSKATEKKE